MKLSILIFFSTSVLTFSQQIKLLQTTKKDVSFRGISSLDNSTVWISGNKGTVGKSMDGGKNFFWVSPKGYEDRDFRDIEVFDPYTAVVMAVGEPGIILKTFDSGKTWIEVFKDETKGVFFDSMDFDKINVDYGFLVGDPLGDYPYVLQTKDKGTCWEKIKPEIVAEKLPKTQQKEVFFAASGSNVYTLGKKDLMYVTGGSKSSFVVAGERSFNYTLISQTDSPTLGANAIDFCPFQNYGIIVGGDFNTVESSNNNITIFDFSTINYEVNFTKPKTPPSGYKSDVQLLANKKAVTCGISGVDYTTDKGLNWKQLSKEEFHVCNIAKNGNNVFLAGPNGNFGVFTF